MDKITLTQKTVDAIIGYKETLFGKSYFKYQEEAFATFCQGDYTIDVQYDLYMEWGRSFNSHNEMASYIPEDLSHWVCYMVVVRDVCAFDNDGNELEITNRELLFK